MSGWYILGLLVGAAIGCGTALIVLTLLSG